MERLNASLKELQEVLQELEHSLADVPVRTESVQLTEVIAADENALLAENDVLRAKLDKASIIVNGLVMKMDRFMKEKDV